jgi:hypothetical protein
MLTTSQENGRFQEHHNLWNKHETFRKAIQYYKGSLRDITVPLSFMDTKT